MGHAGTIDPNAADQLPPDAAILIARIDEEPGEVPLLSPQEGRAETDDDWSCATFWYEPTPSAALPEMPDLQTRTADLWQPPETSP